MTQRIWIESWLLPRVAKPNRYIGNYRVVGAARPLAEGGAAAPDLPGGVSSSETLAAEIDAEFQAAGLRILVLHPELFEAGLADPLTIAVASAAREAASRVVGGLFVDRAFLPWPDMEALLRSQGQPLWGLESFRSAASFDLILVTLNTPLQAADALRCLELAGAAPRPAAAPDARALIGWIGPGVANPAPCAAFADFFAFGDPAACLPALIEALARVSGPPARRLEALEGLPGLLPGSRVGASESGPAVRAALMPAAAEAPMLLPPQPLVEAESEGLPLVVQGGGTAARFEAGPRTWLPAWVLDPEVAFQRVEAGLRETGQDRVDLQGDTPAHHPEIARLVEGLVRRHPGLRVHLGDFGWRQPEPALARELLRGKRATFTWTPWAGTERLRRVLNVEMNEDRLIESVAVALRGGCHLVRLRFGIGWPTETEADLQGLAALVHRVRTLGARVSAPPRLQVVLEPFIPRPGTPLQWEAALTAPELEARVGLVRGLVEQGPVQVKSPPAERVAIEAALVRGDAALGSVLEAAARDGATAGTVATPWSAGPWLAAFSEAGLDPGAMLEALAPETPLPWRAVSVGLPAEALVAERARARAAERTPPGTWAAAAEANVVRVIPAARPAEARGEEPVKDADSRAFGRRGKRKTGPTQLLSSTRFRICFAKDEAVRFTAHLDVGRWFERALRRLDLSVGGGRQRQFKLSFGPPLPLGMTGDDEYLDMQFTEEVSESFLEGLGRYLPPGARLLSARPVQSSVESLSQAVDLAEYVVTFPEGPFAGAAIASDTGASSAESAGVLAVPAARRPGFFERLPAAVTAALVRTTIDVARGSEGERIDVRPALLTARLEPVVGGTPRLHLKLNLATAGGGRPELLLPALCGEPDLDPRLARIHRAKLRISGAGREFSPLEVVELGFPWWRDTVRRQTAGG